MARPPYRGGGRRDIVRADLNRDGRMATWRERMDELVRDLQQQRDELRVKAALGKADLRDELAELDEKLDEVKARVAEWADRADDQLDDFMDDAKDKAGGFMKELQERYTRLRERMDRGDAAPPA